MPYCAFCGSQVAAVSFAPCPNCGNSTNGSPPRAVAAAPSGTSPVVIIIVVIGGLLVVVAIIGILSAIAIPNLLTAMQRSKQKRSMADIRALATSLEAYETDHHEYPNADSVDGLVSALVPKYIRTVPAVDGWANKLGYECITDKSGKCIGYVVGSRGKDGVWERSSLRDAVANPPGPATKFDCDIVFSNGSFIEYPEGVQTGGR